MQTDILNYNEKLSPDDREICDLLSQVIESELPEAESKIWHAHPVWFINGNPIVGYSLQKSGVRLMFWSGADFGEGALDVRGNKFKDASIFFEEVNQVQLPDLIRWLSKAKDIQWDYKNLVKRKGKLERIT